MYVQVHDEYITVILYEGVPQGPLPCIIHLVTTVVCGLWKYLTP